VADGRVTREEELELQRIQEYFDVPQQAIAATQMELARFRLLRHISEGDLPNVAVPGLALQKHEVSHWVEPASLLEERVLNREYVGQSRGVSVRIARGVTYRVGAQRGRMVTTTGIVVVSRGSVVITNKRVVFRGDTKGFSIRLDQLLDAQVFEDGLRLMDGSGKARQLQLATVRDVDILAAILSQVVSNVAA
jgi:hypothetical protein